MHDWPARQTVPQAPQLALSVFTFTHVVPHFVDADGQVSEHAPATQTSPDGQAFEHEPQLATSL